MSRILRGFVEVAEGQVHYRAAGQGGVPLVMLHPSPGSALMLQPLIGAMASRHSLGTVDTNTMPSSAASFMRAAIACFLRQGR